MAASHPELWKKFKQVLNKEPCDFQIDAIAASLHGNDVIVIAPTDSGKTYPLLGPVLFEPNGLTIVILALNAISEQIGNILSDPKFGAVVLHGTSLNPKVKKKITLESCHAVIMPVEMFTGDDFAAVLNDKLFQKRLTYICVDDAHVIVQRAQFHEEYRNLVFVRRQLPLVQWYFTSATLTKGHVAYLTDFLSLEDQDTTVIRLSNDRPTVQYILREMEYPANTFKDALVFLGPNPTPYNHPGPTIVYCNSRSDAEDLATFLQGVLNAYGPGMERKITWFHSLNSQDHAKKVVGELLRGKYWILVCTEILGMGADVPGILTVGQYGRPPSLETLIQRASRAGCGTTQPANFILLHPKLKPSATGMVEDPIVLKEEEELVDIGASTTTTMMPPPKMRKKVHTQTQREAKAVRPDSLAAAGFTEERFSQDVMTLLASSSCVRRGLDDYCGNNESQHYDCNCPKCSTPVESLARCCSRCDPTLLGMFDNLLEVKSAPKKRKFVVNTDMEVESETEALRNLTLWADRKVAQLGGFFGGGLCIVSSDMRKRMVGLARMGKLRTTDDLIEQTDWAYTARFGHEILDLLHHHFPLDVELQTSVPPVTPAARADILV